MDIFGDDIDTLMEDDQLNENIRDDDIENINIDGDGEGKDDDEKQTDENGDPIKVEPKKRSVRRPQMRLNVERLKSDRGVHTIEKYFSTVKYRGKGHEREDLNMVMKRLEHWAHRLYPSYRFDDFITQVEKLGRKKEMQSHMYRYRNGLLEDMPKSNEIVEGDENDENAIHMEGFEPIDELDEIIDQQIQNYTMAPRTPAHERTFDSIRSSVIATPRLREQNPIEASTPVVQKPTESANTMSAPQLTSDQMARIAENRRLAQERLRLKKLQAMQNEPSTSSAIAE